MIKNKTIVNKIGHFNPELLWEIVKITDDVLLFRFINSGTFDIDEEIFNLKISVSQDFDIEYLSNYIKTNDYLYSEIVVVNEYSNILNFYLGIYDMDEEWYEAFSVPFLQYECFFSQKTEKDWENQLILFTKQIIVGNNLENHLNISNIKTEISKFVNDKVITRKELLLSTKNNFYAILEKFENLDDSTFYSIFLNNNNLN